MKWEHAVLAILAFGLGSAATAVIQNLLRRQSIDYSFVILFIEAVVLFAARVSRLSPTDGRR